MFTRNGFDKTANVNVPGFCFVNTVEEAYKLETMRQSTLSSLHVTSETKIWKYW